MFSYYNITVITIIMIIMITIIVVVVFQGLGLLAYSGSEFIFLKLMNLFDSW
jgi:hypothetical protein